MPHGSCCGMGHAGQPCTGVAAGLKAVLAGFFIIDSSRGHISGDVLSLLIQGTQIELGFPVIRCRRLFPPFSGFLDVLRDAPSQIAGNTDADLRHHIPLRSLLFKQVHIAGRETFAYTQKTSRETSRQQSVFPESVPYFPGLTRKARSGLRVSAENASGQAKRLC